VGLVLAGFYNYRTGNALPLSLLAVGAVLVVWLIVKPAGLARRSQWGSSALANWGYVSFFASMGWAWLTSQYFHLDVPLVVGGAVALLGLGAYCMIYNSLVTHRSRKQD
jgi:hypothetical protein